MLLPELDYLSLLVKKTRVSNDIQGIGSVNPGPVVVVLVNMGIGNITPNLISLLTGVQSEKSSLARGKIGSSSTAINSEKVANAGNLLAEASSRLGSAASLFETSQEIMESLLKIVDKGIFLADRASKSSTSGAQRRALDRMFQGLGKEFEKLANNADTQGIDLLSKEGLETVLEVAGLSKENSKEISKLINKFFVDGNGSSLADLGIKGSRGAPPTILQPDTSATGYDVRKVSRNGHLTDPSLTFVTENLVLFTDENPSGGGSQANTRTMFSVDNNNSTYAMPYVNVATEIMDVSETSGYILAKSTADYFATNLSGTEQLFLFDSSFHELAQLTFFDSSVEISSASINSTGEKFTFVTGDNFLGGNADGTPELYYGDLVKGTVSMLSDFGTGGIWNHKISEDGTLVGYSYIGSKGGGLSFDGYSIYNTDSESDIISNSTSGYQFVGFSGSGDNAQFVLYHDNNFYTDDSGNPVLLVPGKITDPNQASVTENGYMVYSHLGSGLYYGVIPTSGEMGWTNVVDQGPSSFSSLSVTKLGSGDVKIAATGSISELDSRTQVFLFEPSSPNVIAPNKSISEVSSAFDYSLSNQLAATRAKEDLKAIKKQLERNIKNLGEGVETVESNLKLSILFSETFLNISSDPSAVKSADTIAVNVKEAVNKYRGAIKSKDLEQVDNLISIIDAG